MRAAGGAAEEVEIAQRGGTHPPHPVQMGRGVGGRLRFLEHLNELFLLLADALGRLQRDLE